MTAESSSFQQKTSQQQQEQVVPLLNGLHLHTTPPPMMDPLEIFKQTVSPILLLFIHFPSFSEEEEEGKK